MKGTDMTDRLDESQTQKTGMLGFTIVWIGQLLSLLGTNMTGFGLTIWAWETTGSATSLSLVAFFAFAPLIFVSPFAGAIVDRHDRKKIMMLADLAAGLPTVAVLLLHTSGALQVWNLFITGAVAASFQAFHFPAYSSAITMMVKKEHYGRASGMLSTAEFAAQILAPIIAAILLGFIGIAGIMIIDISTFLFAISMLFFVHIPRPPTTEPQAKGLKAFLKESFYGFGYIYRRPSLLGLQLTFFAINLISTFANVLLPAMVLARTGNNGITLGTVMSAAGAGGLVGGLLLSVWGGPKRKVNGILLGVMATSLAGLLWLGIGRDVYVWVAASFIGIFFLPTINGSSQAIWQSKVAPELQGRVFATRRMIAQVSVPISMLLAGPLADRVFEPAMATNGGWANTFGPLVGTGAGAGMALMFVITGILGAMVGLIPYLIRVIRDVEDLLPDHDRHSVVTEESKE